jgi:polar amino acid transport system substrate-binding protein
MNRIIIILLVLCFSCRLTAQELKLGGTEWPPYVGKDIEQNGIAAQIVTRIFARAGHDARFLFYPWSRTQEFVKRGELDGLGIAWFTEERAKTMVYSRPYINTAIVLVKRETDPFIYTDIQDLHGKIMGVILGYGYLKKIESAKIEKRFVKSLRQNLMKLANHRIDLTMEEKLNAQIILSGMPEEIQNKLTIVETPFEVKPLHITLSKSIPNHKELINDFDRALSSMIEDGTYQDMLDGFRFSPLHCCK